MKTSDNLYENIYANLILLISEYVKSNGYEKTVIGLSGGIDSAIVATLLVHAIGSENVLGVLMPSKYSSNHSVDDSLCLAENLKIKTVTTPIKSIYDSYFNEIVSSVKASDMPLYMKNDIDVFDVSYENMQARIRAIILMTFSNKYKMMLVNTGNRSEFAMGYSTIYGDLCGMLSPIGDLYKTEVFALSRYINKKFNKEIIPTNSIEKAPSAELKSDQKDSDSLPDYEVLDSILKKYLDKKETKESLLKEYDEELINFILSTYKKQEFKRKLSPYIIPLRNLIDNCI